MAVTVTVNNSLVIFSKFFQLQNNQIQIGFEIFSKFSFQAAAAEQPDRLRRAGGHHRARGVSSQSPSQSQSQAQTARRERIRETGLQIEAASTGEVPEGAIIPEAVQVGIDPQTGQPIREQATTTMADPTKVTTEGAAQVTPEVVSTVDKVREGVLPSSFDAAGYDAFVSEQEAEVKAALEGKTLETIELTRTMENTINSILGPGVADNYNLEQLLANYQDNPTAFTQEFLPKLQDQFQARFTQYAGTNVKAYEDIAPEFRREWENITGAKPDEQSAQWNQFIATNDVAERKDIAFAAAAETGSQTYRDQFKSDMERVFGKAGARSTGGGRFGL